MRQSRRAVCRLPGVDRAVSALRRADRQSLTVKHIQSFLKRLKFGLYYSYCDLIATLESIEKAIKTVCLNFYCLFILPTSELKELFQIKLLKFSRRKAR